MVASRLLGALVQQAWRSDEILLSIAQIDGFAASVPCLYPVYHSGLTRGAGVRVGQEAQTQAVVTATAQIDTIAMEVRHA